MNTYLAKIVFASASVIELQFYFFWYHSKK